MPTGFIAVVRDPSPAARQALGEAGATAVLSWGELATCPAPDGTPVVLFDPAFAAGTEPGPELDPTVVLATLASLEGADGQDTVIATVLPVVDTLKLVDSAGVLTGTAERDDHRFVGAPIATRLRLLRPVSREVAGPQPVAVLRALVRHGATVLAGG